MVVLSRSARGPTRKADDLRRAGLRRTSRAYRQPARTPLSVRQPDVDVGPGFLYKWGVIDAARPGVSGVAASSAAWYLGLRLRVLWRSIQRGCTDGKRDQAAATPQKKNRHVQEETGQCDRLGKTAHCTKLRELTLAPTDHQPVGSEIARSHPMIERTYPWQRAPPFSAGHGVQPRGFMRRPPRSRRAECGPPGGGRAGGQRARAAQSRSARPGASIPPRRLGARSGGDELGGPGDGRWYTDERTSQSVWTG